MLGDSSGKMEDKHFSHAVSINTSRHIFRAVISTTYFLDCSEENTFSILNGSNSRLVRCVYINHLFSNLGLQLRATFVAERL